MEILYLHIKNLRNHINTEIEIYNNLNVFYGKNGSGKTTILEAISLCSLAKSFTQTPDTNLINTGADAFQINCDAKNIMNLDYNIKLLYQKGMRKKISTNFGDNLSPKDIIGEMPLVVLSPDLNEISKGVPEKRREFIDKILSQISKSYYEELINFRKALRNRNAILNNYKNEGIFNGNVFDSWNEIFINYATKIVYKRLLFFRDFPELFRNYYQYITSNNEEVNLIYEPSGFDENENIYNFDINDIKGHYNKISKEKLNIEKIRGLTLFGPQKDDFQILINGYPARDRASQGQHKSIIIALKFAEFDYMKERKNELPIVLLDDIFSELDEHRSNLVLGELLKRNAQTFITSTNRYPFELSDNYIEKISFYKVEDGIVKKSNLL
ncbi:MAG TPA: DNA replication and repair protein RecF [Candidatus Kapabacteria bacterium]|nr:DNA replication and repair protein RecF [Candidatus Kapabacteria bacterium]HOV92366.1 DNA replication and repair protein RecF [Candidatus Kapabacteria bacterium]